MNQKNKKKDLEQIIFDLNFLAKNEHFVKKYPEIIDYYLAYLIEYFSVQNTYMRCIDYGRKKERKSTRF